MALKKATKIKYANLVKLLGIICLIAFIIILLYSILDWAPPGGNPNANECVSQSVYYVCQNPIYNHTTGIISVYLGQDTGSNWTTTSFVFVPIGTQINKGIPSISFNSYPANTFYSENKLTSGKIVNVSLQVNDTNPPINIGTSAKGTIWVRYTIQGNLTQQYAQMASVNIKAS